MKLQVAAYPLEKFDIHAGEDGRTLVAESSDLEGFRLQRLYDDAADLGIAIRSHYTGKEVRFYLSGQDMNADDIAGWRFKVAQEPGNQSTIQNVLVIND